MRAWWSYWVLIAVTAVTWLAAATRAKSAGGLGALLGEPAWAVALLVPPFLAGLNLILFRDRHEEVCRLEVARHRWLDVMTSGGYSARTFALSGLLLVVLPPAIVIAAGAGRR